MIPFQILGGEAQVVQVYYIMIIICHIVEPWLTIHLYFHIYCVSSSTASLYFLVHLSLADNAEAAGEGYCKAR